MPRQKSEPKINKIRCKEARVRADAEESENGHPGESRCLGLSQRNFECRSRSLLVQSKKLNLRNGFRPIGQRWSILRRVSSGCIEITFETVQSGAGQGSLPISLSFRAARIVAATRIVYFRSSIESSSGNGCGNHGFAKEQIDQVPILGGW